MFSPGRHREPHRGVAIQETHQRQAPPLFSIASPAPPPRKDVGKGGVAFATVPSLRGLRQAPAAIQENPASTVRPDFNSFLPVKQIADDACLRQTPVMIG
jgi:hypothetical protein